MRILIICAIVLSILALICAITPATLIAGQPWNVWLIAAVLAYFLDVWLGGYLVVGTMPARRGTTTQV